MARQGGGKGRQCLLGVVFNAINWGLDGYETFCNNPMCLDRRVVRWWWRLLCTRHTDGTHAYNTHHTDYTNHTAHPAGGQLWHGDAVHL